MMMNDGSVVPSFLRELERPSMTSLLNSDVILRQGTVIRAYAPNDSGNINKVVWEYDVQVAVADSYTTPYVIVYPHAMIGSMFGGVADYFQWAPRISELAQGANIADTSNQDSAKKLGSSVLLLCRGGQVTGGTIISGWAHSATAQQSTDFKDPLMRFEYNGLFVEINKDGELTATRKGPTKTDGEPVDKNDQNVGASLTFNKDGQVIIQTTDEKQQIKLDLQSGKIETKAEQGVKLGGDEHLILGDKYTDAEDKFLQAFDTFLTQLISGLASSAGGLSASGVAAGGAAGLTQVSIAAGTMKGQLGAFKAQLKQLLSQKNTTE